MGKRDVSVYCETEKSQACAMCAAKYHRKCEKLFDTYDLTVESRKLIEEELASLSGERQKGAPEDKKDARSAARQAITRKEVEEMKGKVEKDATTYGNMMNSAEDAFRDNVQAKKDSLQETQRNLIRDLENLDEQLKRAAEGQEEHTKSLRKMHAELTDLTEDKHFLEVFRDYESLQQRGSQGLAINERGLKSLRKRLQDFEEDKSIQNIQRLVQDMAQRQGPRKGSYHYQDFQNLVYFLTPYSFHMYTYDVDAKVASIIKLMDENGKEFRMKFNSSTLYVNNRIFLIGGTEKLSLCGRDCWEYSFLHNSVRKFKPMNLARREHSVVLMNKHIYSVGGWGEEIGDNDERTNKGLTSTCEKILVDAPGQATQHWQQVKKLNAPKSAVSLCTFEESGTIYAIGGLAKDTKAFYFERLHCETDALPDQSADRDYSLPISKWDPIELAVPSAFTEGNKMVGSFSYTWKDENYILLFIGGDTAEASKAYTFKETERKLEEFACPKIKGTASLHNRRPLYTNKKKDIYFVAFYDILHFQIGDKPDWCDPTPTKEWISYK